MSGSSVYDTAVNVGVSDFDATWTIGGWQTGYGLVLFRVTANTNGTGLFIAEEGASYTRLYRRNGPASHVLIGSFSSNAGAWSAGDVIRVLVIGDVIKAWRNGLHLGELTTSYFNQGTAVGFSSWLGGCSLDSLTVTST